MNDVVKLKRVVIKEEIFSITQDTFEAIILGQFIYWQGKVNDFDKYISEEKKRCDNNGEDMVMNPTNGWMYKKASELIDECMLTISENTARKYIKNLEAKGFICSRTNPVFKWDKVLQYRVNMSLIIDLIKDNGYDGLSGYNVPNRNNYTSKLKFRASELENYVAIPETTSEITNKEEKKDTIVSKEKNIKFDFLKALIELGVNETVANDWMLVRKNKKATNSETAFNSIEREIAKSNASPTECITVAVERDWKGFKAEWFKNVQPYEYNDDYIKGRIDEMQSHIDANNDKQSEVIVNGKTYR